MTIPFTDTCASPEGAKKQKKHVIIQPVFQWDSSLQWHHNEHNGISNHRHFSCLLNRLFRSRSRKTSKLRVTGLCVGNSPVTGEFPSQRASNVENVSIWWCHHVTRPIHLHSMGNISCVEFQRYPFKFHTKHLTCTLKDVKFTEKVKIQEPLNLQAAFLTAPRSQWVKDTIK